MNYKSKLIQFSKSIFVVTIALAMNGCNGGNSDKKTSDDSDLNNKDRSAVKSDRQGLNEVMIEIAGDIDKLNPITSTSTSATYAKGFIFSILEDVDADSFNIYPVLCVARPEVKLLEDGPFKGGMSLTYEIRPEAKWDNGSPITAEDMIFTFKAIKNPHVDAEPYRPYVEFLKDATVDPANPKKFTLYSDTRYFAAEYSLGNLAFTMPAYFYDPKGIMKKFSLKDLSDPAKAAGYKSNADLIAFAKDFNSEKYARNKEGICGSGPYELDSWETGQRIVLKKKKNWWGAALAGVNRAYIANPDKIIYEVIVDVNSATAALKGEKIDICTLKSKDYLELSKDAKMTDRFKFYKPEQQAYSYIGINCKNPKTSDAKVRRALAHCMDVDKIIEKISFGMAKRVVGPFAPSQPYYAKDLPLIAFDIAKANTLLDEAGWKDSDGDGIRDKTIDGKLTKLSLEIKYPSGSDVVEKIVNLYQENLKKAGIELTNATREWTVYLQETKNHNFELSFGSWSSSPTPDDPGQIWATSSYNGGSNYVGFGNQKSDELIDKITHELDETKRNQLYLEFQKIVYDEQPYVFMSSPLNRIAIHARFDNADAKKARPGYLANEFTLNKTFGSKATQVK